MFSLQYSSAWVSFFAFGTLCRFFSLRYGWPLRFLLFSLFNPGFSRKKQSLAMFKASICPRQVQSYMYIPFRRACTVTVVTLWYSGAFSFLHTETVFSYNEEQKNGVKKKRLSIAQYLFFRLRENCAKKGSSCVHYCGYSPIIV